MFVGLVRYVARGWVEIVLVRPTFFFKYPGFEWLPVFEPLGLYAVFGITAMAALAIALGVAYRWSVAIFFTGFTYIQLTDVTNYLNHYYLVVLVAALLFFLPADRALSVRSRSRGRRTVPRWSVDLLRFQVGVVYVYAALAKLGTDWLVYGQPLNLWMTALNELPLVGPWIGEPWVAVAMSWIGLSYDASVVPLLLWKRTRALAYAAVVVFHGFTWLFFDIGMFPFIMVAATTIFFEPDWPARVLGHNAPVPPVRAERSDRFRLEGPAARALLAAYLVVQVALPARHWLYPGDVLWNEEGMRFSWKVMVREKNGAVTYRVVDPSSGRRWFVSPHEYLDWRQASEMSAQPDLILQLAQHIGWDFRKRGVDGARVYVDAVVSLNGRPPQLMIDPSVDLMEVHGGIASATWILPGPRGAPPTIRVATD